MRKTFPPDDFIGNIEYFFRLDQCVSLKRNCFVALKVILTTQCLLQAKSNLYFT